MKAKEIAKEDLERWKKDGWIPVACRICDEVMLYPSPTYTEKMLVGWECDMCRRRKHDRI